MRRTLIKGSKNIIRVIFLIYVSIENKFNKIRSHKSLLNTLTNVNKLVNITNNPTDV